MAYDLNKFAKYAWLAGIVGFYQVYAAKNPTDPFGQMWIDLQYYLNTLTTGGAWTKIQTKFANIATIVALVILVPIVLKMLKLPVWAKGIVNAAVYYYIGDQAARILDDPVYVSSGITAARTTTQWSQPTSAFHVGQYTPATGVVANIYGG